MADESFAFVVVSNRLPVDRVVDEDGSASWKQPPGGLVTALEPVMRKIEGAWVGWIGQAGGDLKPFTHDGLRIVPIQLSEREIEDYYEGFSNDTIWPLYHDVIVPATYHRDWWDTYVEVNQRFADHAASVADIGATVWVQDYQLQLVPRMLRLARPDLVIGFFNHIPFPAYGLFSQLPWRTQIIEGLLGADVIGFQRVSDAGNFSRAARRLLGYTTRSPYIDVAATAELPARRVVARAFPISIDVEAFEKLAHSPEVQARAIQIREELGNPKTVMLGVDRLDYTKGIGHRLKAFSELLAEGRLNVEDVTLVQVASPSRERVETYKHLRDEIELTVGRINGDFGTIGHQAVNYLHHGFPREEMAALYLASDVMLVTALRDGMNLVAKEYVAARHDEDGVLVLSEFAGAADELRTSLRINPHDIDGLKDAIMQAVEMPRAERRKRMRSLRKRVRENDVGHWSRSFLRALSDANGGIDRLGADPDSLGDLEWTVERPPKP
jgi:trehalose 6-phosphate synthase